jgi:type III secretion protein D
MARDTDTAGSLTLHVLSGIHSGVRAPIEANACTIGASHSCDLVLADRNVAPDHLTLRFYGKLVAIDAVGADVLIEGRPTLTQGRGCRVKLPVTLTVGEAQLRLARDGTNSQTLRRWAPYFAGLFAFVLVPFIALQTGLAGLLPQAAAARSIPQAEAPYAVPSPAVRTPDAPVVPSDEAVAQTLQARLATDGLGSLSVSGTGRRIEVSGTLAAADMAKWQGIQRWFDHTHGGRYLLASGVTTAAVASAPHFNFQAVWFGKNPYVVDAHGEKRFPGAALGDGWLLKVIEPGGILVTRAGEEVRLTL